MTVAVTELSPSVEKWAIDYLTRDRVKKRVKNYKDYGFESPEKACKDLLCYSGCSRSINIDTKEEISVWVDAMPNGITVRENPLTEKEKKAKIKYKRVADEILNKTLF